VRIGLEKGFIACAFTGGGERRGRQLQIVLGTRPKVSSGARRF
jgi:hypothetical protein